MKIRKIWVYAIALAPFALFYELIKRWVDNTAIFVALALCVMLLARLVAERFGGR